MCLIEDQSWIDCIDITSRWDTFVLFHLYGNKEVSLPLWPIRPRWFHTYSPCAEPLGDGHEGMWARLGSQGSIALNWHSRYSGTRYSGTWLYFGEIVVLSAILLSPKIKAATCKAAIYSIVRAYFRKFRWQCNVFCRRSVSIEYGPVTMIVPASDHQVRCIPWLQMGTFNKEISFLCGLKFFALNVFCGEYLYRVYIWCCKYGENRYCERCANK